MKSGRTLVDLARELERQISSKRDLVVPSSFLQCRTDEDGSLKLIVDSRQGDGEYGPRWPVQIPPPVATPNSPRQDRPDYDDSVLMAMREAASLRR